MPRQPRPSQAQCRVDVSTRMVSAFQRAAALDARPIAVREALRVLADFAQQRQAGNALHVTPADGREPFAITLRHIADEADLHKDRLHTELFVLVGESLARHSKAKSALGITSDESVVEMGLALGKLLADERAWHSQFALIKGGRRTPFTVYFGDQPLWLRARRVPIIGAPLSWLLEKLSAP